MKIEAVVKFNDGIALVIDRPIVKQYAKYGNTIIGKDGIFHSSLFFAHERGAKAFAGWKFILTMVDGETVECSGQWWDGMTAKTREIVGDDIIRVTACGKPDLLECYVFNSHYASKKEFEAFLSTYTGRKYGYWEYEAFLKNRKPWRNDKCEHRPRKNHRRFKKIFYKGNIV